MIDNIKMIDNMIETNDLENLEDFDDNFLNFRNIDKSFDNELLNYALHYASLGYPVFPLHCVVKGIGILRCSCKNKENCSAMGKHPRTWNGLRDASTNENEIITWWENYPDSNIGLITGRESGIFVLDIDVRTDIPINGEQTLEMMQDDYKLLLRKNFEPLPATLTAISGSGSRHLYFKYNLDLPCPNSASAIGLGLDVKSDNGYIVAPPSNHKSGNLYKWFGVNTPIENAPDWLYYEIQQAMRLEVSKQKSSVKVKVSAKYNGEKIQETKRNNYFYRYVCGIVNNRSKEEVLRLARKCSSERLNPPLKDNEIINIVNWAWNKFVLEKNKGLPIKK